MIEIPKSIDPILYRKEVSLKIVNAKPVAVYCGQTGNLMKYYVSGREASRRLKLLHNAVQERVGTGKIYKGYRFEFVTDEQLKAHIRQHFKEKKLKMLYKNL